MFGVGAFFFPPGIAQMGRFTNSISISEERFLSAQTVFTKGQMDEIMSLCII